MSSNIIDKTKIRKQFKGKQILVLGIGVLGGGAGVANFFAKLSARVIATDLRSEEILGKGIIKQLRQNRVKLVLAKHRKEDILNSDLIIRNPAVPLDSPFLKQAFENKIPVTMDAALFAKLCPLPIIGITGTRGKTTTTMMLDKILKEAGFHTIVGGNIQGKATLSLLWKLKKDTKVILELSSWALQGFLWEKISPEISLITNIYPDHLNRYPSMKTYIKDKEAIFRFQHKNDLLFLNKDNPYTAYFKSRVQSKVNFFSKNNLPRKIDLTIKGEHNRYNAAAAFGVAEYLSIPKKRVLNAIAKFRGVPARQQIVRVKKGVLYINDTTSTTPTACIMALKAYSQQPIILLIGGASKNLPIDKLVEELKNSKIKKYIFLYGNGTDELIKKLIKRKLIYKKPKIYSSLVRAVCKAKEIAESGDVVLLSPAFTSFSMFKNEFERGEVFNQAVEEL